MLNGFEIINNSYIRNKYNDFTKSLNDYKLSHDIYEAYGRPSALKVQIWNEWKDWANDNNAVLYVFGYCSMFFTIGGYWWDENGDKYFLYITKDYNRAMKLEA